MDSLENRFNNFKQFCNKIKPQHEFVMMLQTTPLPLFLQTIKQKHDQNQNVDKIFEMILEKCEIDVKDVAQEDMSKFKRYIEYFAEVVRAIE